MLITIILVVIYLVMALIFCFANYDNRCDDEFLKENATAIGILWPIILISLLLASIKVGFKYVINVFPTFFRRTLKSIIVVLKETITDLWRA